MDMGAIGEKIWGKVNIYGIACPDLYAALPDPTGFLSC